jgi:hypothetical protein
VAAERRHADRGGALTASPPSAKARTELNVAISYVERAARRLSAEQGHARHARTLERLSGELDEVLARLIAADQRHKRKP